VAELNGVLVDVVKVETLSNKPGGRREIETDLDTTLTFDGLADAPDIGIINEAVLRALLRMDIFLQDYLLPAGLPEFESVKTATATLQVPVVQGEDPPTVAPTRAPTTPAISQVNTATARSFSFDPNDLKILIPAVIGGLSFFLLTIFCLARNRRQNTMDVSYDSYEDDIDHTVNGSQMGKEEIEVQPNTAQMMDYGYHPDGHVDLNSSYGAGHVAMHIPAMDQQSMASGGGGGARSYRDFAPPAAAAAAQTPTRTPAQLYNRGSVIDSPSRADSSAGTSEYSEGQYWR
jgi:hypothetical protein